jgi:hypothetical protein
MRSERMAQNVKDGDTGRARKTRQEKDEDKPCWPHVLPDVISNSLSQTHASVIGTT